MSERHPVPQSHREDSPAQTEAGHLDEQEGGGIKTSIYWSSGPLPDPVQLRQYEEVLPGAAERMTVSWRPRGSSPVLPGAAERIMSTFEAQVGHRMDLEKNLIDRESRRADWGLAVGGLIAGVIVIGALIVMVVGDSWAGASIIGTSVAAIAGVFVYGTKIRSDERNRKDERMRIGR